MDLQACTDQDKLKPCVVLTGTAKNGSYGPPIGLVDIGVSEAAYLFRVALPGIRKEKCKVKCNIHCDGKVIIEGINKSVVLFKDASPVYQMRVQQLCPPGPFSISFSLPGPVDPRLFSPIFRPDGILEVIVMKQRMLPPPDEWFETP